MTTDAQLQFLSCQLKSMSTSVTSSVILVRSMVIVNSPLFAVPGYTTKMIYFPAEEEGSPDGIFT